MCALCFAVTLMRVVTQIFFGGDGRIVGGGMEHYLLEKVTGRRRIGPCIVRLIRASRLGNMDTHSTHTAEPGPVLTCMMFRTLRPGQARVVHQAKSERNFHIFYNLVSKARLSPAPGR